MNQSGNVININSERNVLKRIKRDAVREAKWLYKITGGFVHAIPPDEEMRKMFEEGVMEL